MVNAAVHVAGDGDEMPLGIQDFQQSSNRCTTGIGASGGTCGLRQLESVSVPHPYLLASTNHKFRKFRQESFQEHQVVFYLLFLNRSGELVERNGLAFLELRNGYPPQTCQVRSTAEFLAQIVRQ